jgi:hypothetical protein
MKDGSGQATASADRGGSMNGRLGILCGTASHLFPCGQAFFFLQPINGLNVGHI